MNCINNNATVTQNIKCTMNTLFGSHLKYIKGHCFPSHFVNKRYITRIFCFADCQKAFAIN